MEPLSGFIDCFLEVAPVQRASEGNQNRSLNYIVIGVGLLEFPLVSENVALLLEGGFSNNMVLSHVDKVIGYDCERALPLRLPGNSIDGLWTELVVG